MITNKPSIIDQEQFLQSLVWSMERAQEYYAAGGGELVPVFLVCVDTGEATWHYDAVFLTEFNENRYNLLHTLGAQYGRDRMNVPAVILTTEAWLAEHTLAEWEAHPENRVQPKDDPDRKEVLIVNGMTIEMQSKLMRSEITRAEGEAALGAISAMVDFENAILMAFWRGYAPAYLLAGMGVPG